MPCEWPVDRGCMTKLPDEPAPGADAEVIAAYERAVFVMNAATDLAVFILWDLSARQLGLCSTVARPCPVSPLATLPRLPAYPYSTEGVLFDGNSWQAMSCGCRGRCVQTGPRMVHLPGPVHSVTEVTVGAETLDPSGYRTEGNVLYRIGGKWPGQDLGRPIGEPGTWSVTYIKGRAVPPYVQMLTGVLAAEFQKVCGGGKASACRLPRNVKTVTRQGVTYETYDPADIYKSRKTGLAEVDNWLASVNRNGLTQAPAVI